MTEFETVTYTEEVIETAPEIVVPEEVKPRNGLVIMVPMVEKGTSIYRDKAGSMKDKIVLEDIEVSVVEEFKEFKFIRSKDLTYQGWVEKGKII